MKTTFFKQILAAILVHYVNKGENSNLPSTKFS